MVCQLVEKRAERDMPEELEHYDEAPGQVDATGGVTCSLLAAIQYVRQMLI